MRRLQNQTQQQGLPLSSLMSENKSPLSIRVTHVWTIFAILTFGEMDLSAQPEVSSIARMGWSGGWSYSICVHSFPVYRAQR